MSKFPINEIAQNILALNIKQSETKVRGETSNNTTQMWSTS